MNSDFKYYPQELPRPLQSGYTSKHKPNMIRTTMADGYTRQRLVNQGAPDTVNIGICLTESQYRDFLQWYKADIRSGQDWFVMPLLSTEEDSAIQYKYVRIQNGEVNAALQSTGAKVGSIYKLTMTLDVSNTVVDDGSWDPGVVTSEDEIASLTAFMETDATVSDSEEMEDSINQYTIME